jgi:peptide/nickel transport system substrate-binding protein
MRTSSKSIVLIVATCVAAAVSGGAAASASQLKTQANGSLTVALTDPPASIDPFGTDSADTATLEIGLQIFDTLVKPGATPGHFVPDLATSWSNPSPDVWKFNLRNAEFANGDKVTSNDVAASLQALIAGDSPGSALWTLYKSVTTPNPQTVVINTSAEMGTMLNALTLLYIAPASEVNNSAFWNKPYGSGPFMVTNYVPDESVTLTRNPHYWGPAPSLKTLTMISVPNESDLTSYLKTGKVDVAMSVPPDQAPQLTGTPNLKLTVSPSNTFYFVFFNISRKPFNNVLVRQALWHAVPIAQIVKSVWGRYATVATAPISSTTFGYHKETPYSYDPKLAKQLLARAGYKHGFTTSIMWEANGAPYLQTMASLFTSAWAAVGVKVNMTPYDPATWLKNLLPPALNWNMDIGINTTLTGDADYTLGRIYVSSADRMGYKNPNLDALLLAAKESLSPTQRASLYAQAINILWSQAIGIYPLQVNQITAVRSQVQNFVPKPNLLDSFANVSVR